MLANGQHNKALTDLSQVDVVITMGCGVQCPSLPAQMRQDWGWTIQLVWVMINLTR